MIRRKRIINGLAAAAAGRVGELSSCHVMSGK